MKNSCKEIYVLDDSLEFCKMMLYSLEKSGFVVRAFTKSQDFLKACEARLPSVCLIDLNISKALEGFEIISTVRSTISKDLPLIIVSKHDDDHAVVRAIELGANDYIFKPIDKIMLLSKLSAYIEFDDDNGYKNVKLPPLSEVTSAIELGTEIRLHGIDEFGVWFYSANLISRGIVTTIESPLLSEILQIDVTTKMALTITSCKPSSNDLYLYYGEFSSEKIEELNAIRVWLKGARS